MQRIRPASRAAKCCRSSISGVRTAPAIRALHHQAPSASTSRQVGSTTQSTSQSVGRMVCVGTGAAIRCMSSSSSRMAQSPGMREEARTVVDVGSEVSGKAKCEIAQAWSGRRWKIFLGLQRAALCTTVNKTDEMECSLQ